MTAPEPASGAGAEPLDDAGDRADKAEEQGRLLFARDCRFVAGAASFAQLLDTALPEVAFAGRSNVGKSTLINALTGRSVLARVSSTPGRTRQLNFFDLGGRLMLADLPGYGYARAPKAEVAAWTRLVERYLADRPSLRRVVVLIDGRHGIKTTDAAVMKLLDTAAVSYQVVLTKCDKVAGDALARTVQAVASDLVRRPAAHPDVIATSARTAMGIAAVRTALAALAAPAETDPRA